MPDNQKPDAIYPMPITRLQNAPCAFCPRYIKPDIKEPESNKPDGILARLHWTRENQKDRHTGSPLNYISFEIYMYMYLHSFQDWVAVHALKLRNRMR